MTHRSRQKQDGFTLIELLISIVFVSILLLAIVMTGIHAGRIYSYGVILRSVNQSGRDLGDTMRRDFIQSNRQHVSGDQEQSVITIVDGQAESSRFCLGRYSYLWNSAETLDRVGKGEVGSANPAVVTVNDQPINFIRVVDEDASLCQRNSNNQYQSQISPDVDISALLKQSSGDTVLAIHELTVTPLVHQGDEGLFMIRYTIGTSEVDEINTIDQRCKPLADEQANADFCAINNFEMIARTNG